MSELSEDILNPIVKLIEDGKTRMPQWWTTLAKQTADNLQVHTKGHMFDKIVGLYPNEHPESQKHCIDSYESITKASIWKAINNIIRVFNNSSYNIQISDKTRSVIEQYQENEGSLFSQFLEDWIKYAVATDPNGLCVVYPLEYTEDLYRYVCYDDLITVKDDILIFKSIYESEVKTEIVETQYSKELFIDYQYTQEGIPNTRYLRVKTFTPKLERKYINTVFHVFTKTHFIRFYKDDPGDQQFKYDFYKHPTELETLPYFENGGVEVEKDLYESFVQPFVPFGNLSLNAHRNQRAVELMHYFPRMSEVQQPCDECSSTGKVSCVKTDSNPTGWDVCRVCKGSKFVTFQSPYKVYRKVQDSFDVDGKVFSTPSVEYYSPPTGVLEIVQKQWKEYLELGEEAVFVQKKVETGNVESAKSKEIDREALYAWFANIAKVFFGNLQLFLQYQENYINASPITVSVERPYSFAILTEDEAFQALTSILLSAAPVPIKANQIDSFINKFISESSPVKRAMQILKKFDTLLYYSDETLASYKGMGTIDTKKLIRHLYAYPVLIQLYEEDKTLFDMDDAVIIKKLTAEIDLNYDLTKDLRTAVLSPVLNTISA